MPYSRISFLINVNHHICKNDNNGYNKNYYYYFNDNKQKHRYLTNNLFRNFVFICVCVWVFLFVFFSGVGGGGVVCLDFSLYKFISFNIMLNHTDCRNDLTIQSPNIQSQQNHRFFSFLFLTNECC